MGLGEAVSEVAKGLKESPTSLALIVINVIWLGAGAWLLMKVAERSDMRDKLIMQLAQKECP